MTKPHRIHASRTFPLAFLQRDATGFRIVIAAFALIATLLFAGACPSPAEGAEDAPGRAGSEKEQIVVDVPATVGEKFLLNDYLPPDVAKRIASGRWTVVLFHHDCPECQRVIPLYERLAKEGNKTPNPTPRAVRIALLEVPPYAPRGKELPAKDSACLVARLSDRVEWFVPMLTRFELEDGKVVRAGSGVRQP